MKFVILVIFFVLIGCSHHENKKVTAFPFVPELVEKFQKSGRNPASFQIEDIQGKSSRRVYFSALYHQYLSLGQFLKKDNDVNSCPQFHHDKVETDASLVPSLSLFDYDKITSEHSAFFPESVFNNEFSISDYYQQISEEVATLCEEGFSDNYYKFDNLVTYYSGKLDFHQRPNAMNSVLNIPVFANYYLLQMIKSPHAIGVVHPEEKRAIDMAKTHWFEKYVVEAQRMRNNFMRNEMVQR